MTNNKQRKTPPGNQFGLREAIREMVYAQIDYRRTKYKEQKTK